MCGIGGKVSFRAAVSEDLLRAMAERLAHRGPDDAGFFLDRDVGLLHRRLSIIDLTPNGRQPLGNETGDVQLVLNGEIYNYESLRDGLISAGHRFRSRSDSEVLVHLYEDEGIDALGRLDGMFAFALLDRRARRLFIGRDRCGEKPLYYCESRDGFVFASEVKAILADPEVSPEVDPTAVSIFLWLSFLPAPLTGFRNIAKLPAGHVAELDLETRVLRVRSWAATLDHLGSSERADVAAFRTLADAARAVRDAATRAVRSRLVADVPVGVFLSGGLDSTILVALARQVLGEPPRTFSVRFLEDAVDESQYSRLVAKTFGTEHHEFTARADIVSILEKLVWHYDVPFADEAAVPLWHLAREAREHVKVVLGGEGADELFGGYNDKYRLARVLGRARAFLRGPLRGATRASFSSKLASRALGSDRALALSAGLGADPKLPIWRSVLTALTAQARERHRSVLSRELIDEIDEGRAEAILASRMERSFPGEPATEAMYLDVTGNLADRLLLKTDIATMAHGLEARSPYLAPELADLALSLPDRFKIRARDNKVVLKLALGDLVPREVLARPKQGFRVPIESWLSGELREMAHDLLQGPGFAARGWFDPRGVERVLGRVSSDRTSARLVWRLLMLELWFRTFSDAALHPASTYR